MGIIGKPEWGRGLSGEIRHMRKGEKGFTYPPAISYDPDRNPYLYLKAPVVGYSCIRHGYIIPITRLGEGRADFKVDISEALRQGVEWHISREPFEDSGYDISYIVQLQIEKHQIIRREST